MNKSVRRIACLALTSLMVFSVTACGDASVDSTSGTGNKVQQYNPETRPLVMATDALDGNFNPFFATSAPDNTIIGMTQLGMLSTDRDGKPLCGENEDTVALAYKETMLLEDGKTATENSAQAAYTEYSFIIKNGIKFSDGVDLTIKDVLFNLYVYLDPMYMGSSTIYSTDIVGLKSYRGQDRRLENATEAEIQAIFYDAADTRLSNLKEYLKGDEDSTPEILKDKETALRLFKEELDTDWTNSQGQLESFEENYTFDQDWQVYLYNEGLISKEYDTAGKEKKDDDGKYITNIDADPDHTINVAMNEALTAEKIAAEMEAKGCDEATAINNLAKPVAIDLAYRRWTTTDSDLYKVLLMFATGTNAREEFAAEEKDAYYKQSTSEKIEDISGITTSKTSVDFNGKSLGEEHDVLNIRIYKIDPKAIWNFSFGIAPMHKYSNRDAIENTKYGVKFSDKDFFDNVLKDPAKSGLPVGAGVYMASSLDGSAPDKSDFYNNNWVYFERNPYFHTVGKNISNAKIKYLRFKVVSSDKIVTALETGEIDYAQPNASADNYNKLADIDKLYSIDYKTNGYGYVGINPKHVPDVAVRRAIMMALDTSSLIGTYYGGTLATHIYRPMSTESWAYPEGVGEYYEFTTNKNKIKEMVENAGWKLKGDKYYKDGQQLKLTFTIAGDSNDHPAYDMFDQAKKFLNSCGFEISVQTDVRALAKLATGDLQVWAAAWSSTVDPDMYQVYHKDSNATSTKNWGYDAIKADKVKYSYEWGIIEELSTKIDLARESLDNRKGGERAQIYAEALDLVMDLAVEFPTYQRNDLVVLNKDVVDIATVNTKANCYESVIDRLWEVNYK